MSAGIGRHGRQGWAADTKNGVPFRTLGHTGERVSIVGIGGYHLATPGVNAEEGIRIVRVGLEQGINFLDNCWDYNGGESELRMGKALRDGYRKKAFLMTKIDGRDKATAASQINDSSKRLQTDQIDLLQFHKVIRDNDPDRIFAWRRPRSGAGSEKSWESPLHRIHRAQESRYSFEDAGPGVRSSIHLRRSADAPQRDGSSLQQLRGQRASRSAEAEHRGAGHEAHGRSIHSAEQDRDRPRMLALRHESADQRSNHGMRFPSDPSAGCERGAQFSADAQTGTGRTVGENRKGSPVGRV